MYDIHTHIHVVFTQSYKYSTQFTNSRCTVYNVYCILYTVHTVPQTRYFTTAKHIQYAIHTDMYTMQCMFSYKHTLNTLQ